jgi:hypothetical protein
MSDTNDQVKELSNELKDDILKTSREFVETLFSMIHNDKMDVVPIEQLENLLKNRFSNCLFNIEKRLCDEYYSIEDKSLQNYYLEQFLICRKDAVNLLNSIVYNMEMAVKGVSDNSLKVSK